MPVVITTSAVCRSVLESIESNTLLKREAEERACSDMIDRQIEEDSKKILLLGFGESGKSTIVKQMKIIHQNGYTPLPFRRQSLDQIQYRAYYPANRVCRHLLSLTSFLSISFRRIANVSESSPTFLLFVFDEQCLVSPFDITLRKCHPLASVLLSRHPPFFAEAHRIAASNYLPSAEDILQARAKMTAITETRFPLGQLSIHMVDASSPRTSSPRHANASFDISAIIFCTALSECDQVLLEERNQGRRTEWRSLVLFKSVISSRFLRTMVTLFLNKIGVFKNKLPKARFPLTFPRFSL
ncbi:heterotrimeric G protein alpha subunit [Lactarius hengduanensis]|nr:heterotrimeric G protein alpha subunit [Lactarius hengduanensis]